MLRLVEPYITFGEPNLKTVRELIYKRGYAKVNKQRVPLSDNAVIERELGKYDILSIEDLVHEIFTVGPHFKQASNFLWPFKLSNPTGGWKMRKFKYVLDSSVIAGLKLTGLFQALRPGRRPGQPRGEHQHSRQADELESHATSVGCEACGLMTTGSQCIFLCVLVAYAMSILNSFLSRLKMNLISNSFPSAHISVLKSQ